MCRILDGISGFIQFIVALLTILHLVQMGELIHDLPLINYFILVDLIIMVLSLPYLYLAKKFHVSTQIMKNIFTLNLVQKAKLQERRADFKEGLKSNDLKEIRQYFKKKE